MLLHLLLVAHRTCEHGELVELAAQDKGARARATPAAATEADRSTPQIVADHADGRSHDHCDALAVRHRATDAGAYVAVASLLGVEPIAPPGERGAMRSVPLLSLAPKSSPPV